MMYELRMEKAMDDVRDAMLYDMAADDRDEIEHEVEWLLDVVDEDGYLSDAELKSLKNLVYKGLEICANVDDGIEYLESIGQY